MAPPPLWRGSESFVFAWIISAAAQADDYLSQVSSLRLAGQLVEAQELAEESLSKSPTPFDAVRLHLEIAKIHDRVGLHQNTRPGNGHSFVANTSDTSASCC